MLSSQVAGCLELLVVAFQVVGIGSLLLARLMPTTPWALRGKVALILALFGLGVVGALCGHHDSEFAQFAGLTMTVLLIGLTIGGSPGRVSEGEEWGGVAEAPYAG
jgi:uncharacterized membrane protein YccC